MSYVTKQTAVPVPTYFIGGYGVAMGLWGYGAMVPVPTYFIGGYSMAMGPWGYGSCAHLLHRGLWCVVCALLHLPSMYALIAMPSLRLLCAVGRGWQLPGVGCPACIRLEPYPSWESGRGACAHACRR